MMPVKYGSGCSSAPPAGFPLSAKVRQAFKHTTRTPSQGRQSMKRGGSRIADQAACPTSPIPHSKSSLYFLRITGAIARGPIPHRRPEICVSGILQTIYRPERKARNMQSISYGHIGRPEHQLCTRMATAPNTGQPRNIKNTIIWTRK